MKYLVVIGDGMADNPVEALGGKTPLEYADIPTIDSLAARGTDLRSDRTAASKLAAAPASRPSR